mmetsp:Transcript_128582/g.191578  ORF Transcript_128582/g.191578 Transcript_128582/m.191578 type:complete len:425 (+) Transcript_128582:402-1676(+)
MPSRHLERITLHHNDDDDMLSCIVHENQTHDQREEDMSGLLGSEGNVRTHAETEEQCPWRKDRLQTLALVGLLKQLWPCEKVTMGLCVSRWMRDELAGIVDTVLLAGTASGRLEPASICKSVLRFLHNRVILRWTGGNTGIKALTKGMLAAACSNGCVSLTTLDFRANRMGAEGSANLALILPHCSSLQHLNLSANAIGASGAMCIADSITYCQKLTHVDLSKNFVGSETGLYLLSNLALCSSLRHINLSKNALVFRAGGMSRALGTCSRLQHLNLSLNGIGVPGAEKLAQVLPAITCLEHLDLDGNGFGPEGMQRLAEGLSQCSSLACLSLSSNQIGGAGAECLARVLSKRREEGGLPLECLEAASNGLGDEGAACVAEALRGRTGWVRVNLRLNEIGAEGVGKLQAALDGSHSSLSFVDLVQ